jgi:pimeloyl-ACP methyl ester carboxylesterase
MGRGVVALVVAVVLAGCSAGSGGAAPAATAAAVGSDAGTGTASSGETVRTYRAPDGTEVQYVLVVPAGRSPGVPGKVLLAFPPGGQDLDLTQRIVDDRWRTEALRRDWVVVSPAAGPAGLFYEPTAAALVPGLLDEVARTYPPDGGRFDLAGVSNGGLSAFRAAEDHPDRFRSLVVFPGMPPDDSDADLARLEGLGTAFFVGADDSGWLDGSRRTAAALKALGNEVELTEVPGQGHIIETLTGADLFDAMERVRS